MYFVCQWNDTEMSDTSVCVSVQLLGVRIIHQRCYTLVIGEFLSPLAAGRSSHEGQPRIQQLLFINTQPFNSAICHPKRWMFKALWEEAQWDTRRRFVASSLVVTFRWQHSHTLSSTPATTSLTSLFTPCSAILDLLEKPAEGWIKKIH